MNLKTIATLAATVIASSAWAAGGADQKCGAATCGKKEANAPKQKDASCSKKDDCKDVPCPKTDAACSKK